MHLLVFDALMRYDWFWGLQLLSRCWHDNFVDDI